MDFKPVELKEQARFVHISFSSTVYTYMFFVILK